MRSELQYDIPVLLDKKEEVIPASASPPKLRLYGKYTGLMDAGSGRLLYGREAGSEAAMASTTKIMTCILALENGDVNAMVVCGEEVRSDADGTTNINHIPTDSSQVGLRVGEELSLSELLYGLMLKSGNDCANAIAVHIGGTVQGFVDMMNARAEEMGLSNTHFMNPHGYEWEGHYSTARDMARLGYTAMQNPVFAEIVNMKTATISANNERSTPIKLDNANTLVFNKDSNKYDFFDGVGIKTGYFERAGQCFVGAAQREGRLLICSTFKSPGQSDKWVDAIRMFKYGFEAFDTYDPATDFTAAANSKDKSQTSSYSVPVSLSSSSCAESCFSRKRRLPSQPRKRHSPLAKPSNGAELTVPVI